VKKEKDRNDNLRRFMYLNQKCISQNNMQCTLRVVQTKTKAFSLSVNWLDTRYSWQSRQKKYI
jgi:hypothetical protein